jgi:predicted Rossmann-fold nucleotide-binding protein
MTRRKPAGCDVAVHFHIPLYKMFLILAAYAAAFAAFSRLGRPESLLERWSARGRRKEELMLPRKIISGGQTGVDRAALDVALELGIPIGGHLPRGRKDENGDILPEDKYANMQETDTDDVNVRTELNVRNSDATLVFSHGTLSGGSKYTQRMARKHGKPCLHVDFDKHDADQAVLLVKTWLSDRQPRVLNVAGPRASKDPEVNSKARCVLAAVLASGRHGAARKRDCDESEG